MIVTYGFSVTGFLISLFCINTLVDITILAQINNIFYSDLMCCIVNGFVDLSLNQFYFRVQSLDNQNPMNWKLYSYKVWIYIVIFLMFGIWFRSGEQQYIARIIYTAIYFGLMNLIIRIYIFKETNYLEEVHRLRIDVNKHELV